MNYSVECDSGKIPYTTTKAAKTALNSCKRKRGWLSRRTERSIYRCEICLNFHLTSELPGESRFT